MQSSEAARFLTQKPISILTGHANKNNPSTNIVSTNFTGLFQHTTLLHDINVTVIPWPELSTDPTHEDM